VIHYEIVVLNLEQFTSMVQMLMCCWNVGLPLVNTQSQHRSQLLALQQSGDRTSALLSKNIDRAVKSLHASFSDSVRSLNGVLCSDRFPVSNIHEIVPNLDKTRVGIGWGGHNRINSPNCVRLKAALVEPNSDPRSKFRPIRACSPHQTAARA
jgi:hypothetical protein